MLEGRFPRDIGALPAIFEFVAQFGSAHGITEDQRFDVDLIIEELFTNMVKYNTAGTRPITIGLERERERLIITLRDFDVEPFDVTKPVPGRSNDPNEAPMPGGRGLQLVRQVADDVRYDYGDRNSTITVTKRLDS